MLSWLRKKIQFLRRKKGTSPPVAPEASDFDPQVTSPSVSAYASDAPVSVPSEDRFGRWPFAQRIAQTIASLPDPSSIVIGIYGAWGEGRPRPESGWKLGFGATCIRSPIRPAFLADLT